MEQSSTCLWKDENEISYRIENPKDNNEGEISQSEDTSHDDTRTNELNCNNESNELNSIQQQNQNILSPSSWHNNNNISYISESIQAQSRSFDDDNLRSQTHNIPRKKRAYSFDPERIKRPMNSFLLFSNEIRPILQAKYRDKSNAQISKLVGEEWHKLDEEKKKEYILKAEKIKEEFNKMYPNFVYTKRRRKRYQTTNLHQKARYDIYPNYYYYNQYINDQPYSLMHPPSIYDLETHDHFEHDYYYQSMINNTYPLPPNTHAMRHHLSSPFTFNHRHGQFHHQFQSQQSLQQQPSQHQQQPPHQLQQEQISSSSSSQFPLMNQSNDEQSRQQQKNDHISNITCAKDKEEMKSKLLVKEE